MAEIKKILIANRGEIVQRAIRTIKEMGKKSVAVYSAGDKNASYLKHADEAVCIGGAKSSESYLNIPALITAAEMTGCDAIFPGYGFLSENQDFVEICKLHNIKFIGPSSEVMEKMADKSKAKEEMVKAGVPVVPGSKGAVRTLDEGKRIARHEIATNLEQIVMTAKYLLKNRAPLYLVHRPERLMDIINVLNKYKFSIKKIQLVYSSFDKPAAMVLIKATKNGADGVIINPPLNISNRNTYKNIFK